MKNTVIMDNSDSILLLEFSRIRELLSEIKTELREQHLNRKQNLSIDELSRLIGLPKGTIYKMTSKNEIPFAKVGKHLRFSASEVSEWIKGKTINPKSYVN